MKEMFVSLLEKFGLFNEIQIIEPVDEVAETEKVIGEMNELEKVLYSNLILNKSKFTEFFKKNDVTKDEIYEHRIHRKKTEFIHEMLFLSIESRLKSSGAEIRKGFKIVEIEDPFYNPIFCKPISSGSCF